MLACYAHAVEPVVLNKCTALLTKVDRKLASVTKEKCPSVSKYIHPRKGELEIPINHNSIRCYPEDDCMNSPVRQLKKIELTMSNS